MTAMEMVQAFLLVLRMSGWEYLRNVSDEHQYRFDAALKVLCQAQEQGVEGAQRLPRVFNYGMFRPHCQEFDLTLIGGFNWGFTSYDLQSATTRICVDEQTAERMLAEMQLSDSEQAILEEMAGAFRIWQPGTTIRRARLWTA